MRISKILFISIVTLVFYTSCGKDDTQPIDDLVITIQNQYETPPSRVSVFFKVEKRDGTPVSGLTEENYTIYEKGRNDDKPLLLSEDETTRILSDNAQVFKSYNMLLLDLSGSVLNSSLPMLKTASKQFIDDVTNSDVNTSTTVGIYWFDGRDAIHPLIDFTDNTTALKAAIDGITPAISSDSSTDLFGAVLKSTALAEVKIVESSIQNVLSAVSLVVFTDGTDQAARYSKEDAYDAINDASESISFYTIGLGSEIDERALDRIGKTSSVFANNTAALTTKFEEIAQLIHDEANSHYLFEYCTPKRDGSGINELHIHVTKGNSTGRKITEFDATGFEDDCDLQ